MTRANKVLLVDNIASDRELIDVFLKESYNCMSIDSRDLQDVLDDKNIGCILLEVRPNDNNGLEMCRAIRKECDVPIIVVSAKADSSDKIRALNFGADDFVEKPYDPNEIFARMKAIARRSRIHMMEEDIAIGPLRIDMDNSAVYVNDKRISMPPREVKLLNFLAANPNKALSRKQVLEKVWGFEFFGDSRTVDVHIKRIREKIEKCTDRVKIATVWGVGYKFEVDIE